MAMPSRQSAVLKRFKPGTTERKAKMFEQLHDGSLYYPMAGEILDVQNRCLEKLYDVL